MGWIRDSPKDSGILRIIAIRPAKDQRRVLDSCEVSPEGGVQGDNWLATCRRKLEDGRPDPDVQVTMMNSRLISLLAADESSQVQAGDQFYADLDLSESNLPVGQRLAIGTAVFEVTPEPHTGCGKFVERFGLAALKFINTPDGRSLRLRGVYLKTVAPGSVARGDLILKV